MVTNIAPFVWNTFHCTVFIYGPVRYTYKHHELTSFLLNLIHSWFSIDKIHRFIYIIIVLYLHVLFLHWLFLTSSLCVHRVFSSNSNFYSHLIPIFSFSVSILITIAPIFKLQWKTLINSILYCCKPKECVWSRNRRNTDKSHYDNGYELKTYKFRAMSLVEKKKLDLWRDFLVAFLFGKICYHCLLPISRRHLHFSICI